MSADIPGRSFPVTEAKPHTSLAFSVADAMTSRKVKPASTRTESPSAYLSNGQATEKGS